MSDLQLMTSALATYPDVKAAEWIQNNTPQDARFLLNSIFAYGDSAIVGSDGGRWLPLLARRQTTLPPLNFSSELGPRPDYVFWVNTLTAEIQNKGIANPGTISVTVTRRYIRVHRLEAGAGELRRIVCASVGSTACRP